MPLIYRALLYYLLVGIAFSEAVTAQESLLEKANRLEWTHQYEQAIKIYHQLEQAAPADLEILRGLSLCYNRWGWLQETKKEQLALYNKAKFYADKINEHHPGTFESHYAQAGALCRLAEFGTPEERVKGCRLIIENLDKAEALRPDHPDIWHMRAWLNYEISKANWLERAAARILFGGLPSGTAEKAIDYILTAIRLKPDYVVLYHDIGVFYHHLGNAEKAAFYLRKGLACMPSHPEDGKYLKWCAEFLQQLGK